MNSLHLPIFTISILFSLIPSSSISFNFTTFNNNPNVTLHGSAYRTPDGHLQLTNNEINGSTVANVGRASYKESIPLWDKTTRKFADFTTHFSFSIYSGADIYGDGISFFLAPDTLLDVPAAGSIGGSLGLTIDPLNINSTNQFVAIEFDTYFNTYDPSYVNFSKRGEHVGIDVNSVNSTNTSAWGAGVGFGRQHDAWISYNSTTTNLSVVFTNYVGNDTSPFELRLSRLVNLSEILPESIIVGFSATTGQLSEKNTIMYWSFTSSLVVTNESRSKRNIGLLVGLVVGGASVFITVLVLVWLVSKKQKRNGSQDDLVFGEEEFEKGTGPKKFSYGALEHATSNFDEGEKLGEGGFGDVYKGFLSDLNLYVAVKRISRGSKQGIKEYASEVRIITRLRHKNLVKLIGWCHQNKELLLVYEFLPNGSLDTHLFKETSLLTWEMRYKIAQDLASALRYLHEDAEQCVVHRDIKSSNVMLDLSFNVKLGDFGLARLVDHGKGSENTILGGTPGYMAPECFMTGKSSTQSDVYSYGVVLLEIASGRKAVEFQKSLVEQVWGHYERGNLADVVDKRLCGNFDQKQMEHLLLVGLWCAHPTDTIRPSIHQVIQLLNFEASLPDVLPKVPVPSSFATVDVNSLLSSSNGFSGYEMGETQSTNHSNFTDSSKFTTSETSSPSVSLLHSQIRS